MAVETLGRTPEERYSRNSIEEESLEDSSNSPRESEFFASEDSSHFAAQAPESQTSFEDKELSKRIESAASIEDLIDIVNNEPAIYGSKVIYPGREVARRISEAAIFLRKNIDSIILCTITGKDDEKQSEFAKMFATITRGQDLGIRQKAQELLKGEMNKRFEEKKGEFAVFTVSSVKTIEELCQILKDKFKTIREGETVFDKEKIVKQIQDAQRDLADAVEIGTLAQASLEEVDKNIKSVIRGIPHDSGIYDKAFGLLWEIVKEKRLNKYAKDISSSSSDSNSNLSAVKKIGLFQRVKGLFSRKK
jgi:hypothetical protein